MSKEAFFVAGDAANPTGHRDDRGRRGVVSGHDMTKTAAGHPVILWIAPDGSEKLLTVEVYRVPGAPARIHLLCPMCEMRNPGKPDSNALNISQDQKSFEYDTAPPPMFPGWTRDDVRGVFEAHGIDIVGGGTLDVEPFACTWEETPDLQRGLFGMGRCGWRVSITKNVARSA